jgi:hypothetical protein
MTEELNNSRIGDLEPKEYFLKFAGISSRTEANYRAARSGPPFYKIGRRIMYSRQDIEDWVKSRRINSDVVQQKRAVPPRRYVG